MGKMEVLVGTACVFGIRNGRAGVPKAGDDEGIGSECPILKRSECRGVDVGSILSRFQAVVLSSHEIDRSLTARRSTIKYLNETKKQRLKLKQSGKSQLWQVVRTSRKQRRVTRKTRARVVIAYRLSFRLGFSFLPFKTCTRFTLLGPTSSLHF